MADDTDKMTQELDEQLGNADESVEEEQTEEAQEGEDEEQESSGEETAEDDSREEGEGDAEAGEGDKKEGKEKGTGKEQKDEKIDYEKKYSYKVSGKEVTKPLREILANASRAEGADEKFRESAQIRKGMKKFFDDLAEDPIRTSLNVLARKFGSREIAEQRLKQASAAYMGEILEFESMSPEQKELYLHKKALREREEELKKIRYQQQLEQTRTVEKQRVALLIAEARKRGYNLDTQEGQAPLYEVSQMWHDYLEADMEVEPGELFDLYEAKNPRRDPLQALKSLPDEELAKLNLVRAPAVKKQVRTKKPSTTSAKVERKQNQPESKYFSSFPERGDEVYRK